MATENKGLGLNYGKVMPLTNGRPDVEKLLAQVREEASAWIAENSLDEELLMKSVLSAYDRLPDSQKKSIDIQSLCFSALQTLSKSVEVPVGHESKFSGHIANFLRAESARFVSSGGSEGRFHIGTGRTQGGVNLATEKYVADWRANQAKKTAAAQQQS